MKNFVATFRELLFGSRKSAVVVPVYHFFFKTSSGERKKVYDLALKRALAE